MITFVSTINFIHNYKEDTISKVISHLKDDYNIEISSGHKYEKLPDDVIDDLSSWEKKYDKKILLHNFSPPDETNLLINLSNEENIDNVKKFIKKRIDYTKKLGMDYYSFHAGYRVNFKFGVKKYKNILSKNNAMDFFLEELKDVLNYAERKNIKIGIENHVVEKQNKNYLLFGDKKDFQILFDNLKSRYLYLHLDFGHLNVSSKTLGFNKEDFVEEFSDKILAVHMNENNGLKDEHKHIRKDSWFLDLLKKIPNLEYCILETKTKNRKEIKEMIEIIEKHKNIYKYGKNVSSKK